MNYSWPLRAATARRLGRDCHDLRRAGIILQVELKINLDDVLTCKRNIMLVNACLVRNDIDRLRRVVRSRVREGASNRSISEHREVKRVDRRGAKV